MGQLGGVAANAQGKYESGERLPKADYLAALASVGVDVLFVLTNRRATGLRVDNLFNRVENPTGDSEALMTEVQHAVRHFLSTIEELSNTYDVEGRQSNVG
jgi:transcriptional regulator with XRE-family HTH domain